jgi:hypothetical protein
MGTQSEVSEAWKLFQREHWNIGSDNRSNWFLMMPSIATKFRYVNSPFFSFLHTLHVSAPTGHLHVRYTIRYFKGYFYYNGSVARTQLDVSVDGSVVVKVNRWAEEKI